MKRSIMTFLDKVRAFDNSETKLGRHFNFPLLNVCWRNCAWKWCWSPFIDHGKKVWLCISFWGTNSLRKCVLHSCFKEAAVAVESLHRTMGRHTPQCCLCTGFWPSMAFCLTVAHPTRQILLHDIWSYSQKLKRSPKGRYYDDVLTIM